MIKKLRVSDVETTGMEDTDVVVELGWADVVDDGYGWRVGECGSSLHHAHDIPPQVRAVHHISVADVAGCAPFDPDAFWRSVEADGVAAVATHNVAFDERFLLRPTRPFICTLKAAYRVWPDAPAHNNGTLRYWLEDQDLIAPDPAACLPPHRAGPDAYVTAHILVALLQHATAAQMAKWTAEPPLLPRCPIGEHRGKPWSEVDAGFLRWMIGKPVEPDLVWNARRELERRAAA